MEGGISDLSNSEFGNQSNGYVRCLVAAYFAADDPSLNFFFS